MRVNRRSFLKLLGLAPVAPVVYSFIGTGVRVVPETLSFNGIPIRTVDALQGGNMHMTATEVVMRQEARMGRLRTTLDEMNREWAEGLHYGKAREWLEAINQEASDQIMRSTGYHPEE
jgi:hypothetical protein